MFGLQCAAKRFALALVLVVAAGGCGSKPQHDMADGKAQPPGNAPEPALPAPASLTGLPPVPLDAYLDPTRILARRGAAVGEIGLNGSDVYQMDQGGAVLDAEGQALGLNSNAGALSWGIYRFAGLVAGDAPLVLHLTLDGEMLAPFYVALADYGTGAWAWTPVATPQAVANIPAPPSAISPGGNVFAVVAVYGGAALQVREAALELDTPLPPPLGFQVLPGDGDQTPTTLEWIDPALSYDPDGSGPGAFDYTGVRVDESDSPAGPWSVLASVNPGPPNSYLDLATLGQQPGATPPRYYQLHTMSLNGIGLGTIVRTGIPEFAVNTLAARLSVTPLSIGSSPGVVKLNGTASTHSGTLKSVQWDTDGNGTWDKTTTPTLTTTATMSGQGPHYPRLRLTMDIGGGSVMTDTATAFVSVADYRGDWNQQGRSCGHDHAGHLSGPGSASLAATFTGARFLEPVINNAGNVYPLAYDSTLHILKPDLSAYMDVPLGKTPAATGALTTTGFFWVPVSYGLFQYKLLCVWPDFSVHEYETFGAVNGSPVTAPTGFITYIAANDKLYAAYPSPSSGIKTWYDWVYVPAKDSFVNQPGVDRDGFIYFGVSSIAGGPYFYSLDRNGKLRWRKNVGGLASAPAVGPEGYIYTVINGRLYSFDLLGNNRWEFDLGYGDMLSSAPAISPEGNVVVASQEGRIYIVHPNGYLAYPLQQAVGREYTCQPSIGADGNMYLIATDGKMYALTKKGYDKWSYGLDSAASGGGIAIGNNGRLYCGGTNKLTALK